VFIPNSRNVAELVPIGRRDVLGRVNSLTYVVIDHLRTFPQFYRHNVFNGTAWNTTGTCSVTTRETYRCSLYTDITGARYLFIRSKYRQSAQTWPLTCQRRTVLKTRYKLNTNSSLKTDDLKTDKTTNVMQFSR